MPTTNFDLEDKFQYLAGFNNFHESEAEPGALPIAQNLPQKTPYGLYIERISGSAFTAPRKDCKQTWLYRLLPSTCHEDFVAIPDHPLDTNQQIPEPPTFSPGQSMWAPVAVEEEKDFLSGLQMIGGASDPALKSGLAYYVFTAGKSMPENHVFGNVDGDMLLAPQQGVLDVRTELGYVRIRPNEIGVVPRGIRFNVSLPAGPVRGFVLDVYEGHFDLPELGPLGSCGLANVRDFQVPVANYDESNVDTILFTKYAGKMYQSTYRGSIFNVVSWQGTYYPFKYDLGRFNTMGSISYDHPDPSIYTILSVPSAVPGEAVVDVICFAPRWLVMENTYRPPYYHLNTMSEFTFLIQGGFDVRTLPPSLHGLFALSNTMGAHGPDAPTHQEAISALLKPHKIPEHHNGVMFESRYPIGLSRNAVSSWTRLPSKSVLARELKKVSIKDCK